MASTKATQDDAEQLGKLITAFNAWTAGADKTGAENKPGTQPVRRGYHKSHVFLLQGLSCFLAHMRVEGLHTICLMPQNKQSNVVAQYLYEPARQIIIVLAPRNQLRVRVFQGLNAGYTRKKQLKSTKYCRHLTYNQDPSSVT